MDQINITNLFFSKITLNVIFVPNNEYMNNQTMSRKMQENYHKF